MSISDYAENAILNKLFNDINFEVDTPYVSLHTANPGEAGADEVAGGSYVRKLGSFGAAASGQVQNDADIEFADMPAETVVAFGIWDAEAAGNFIWGDWLGNHAWKPFTAEADDDALTVPSHGYSDDDRVVVTAEFGGALPTGLAEGTAYFVVSATTDTFQLSATQGGAAINLTTDGSGQLRKVEPKTTDAGDALRFSTSMITIQLR